MKKYIKYKNINKIMSNKFITLFIFIFILSSTFSAGKIITTKTTLENQKSSNHPPICIIGNDEFLPENGVTGGSGTEVDPYIIENWVIISDGSVSEGIFINDTDAYFIIRNCTICGFHHLDEHHQGIEFSVVTHGRIEDTKMSECAIGIYIQYSTENEIENCTCSDYPVYPDGYGIFIFLSTNITIISSTSYNMINGIEISESSDITVQKTECYNNTDFGLYSNNVPRHPIMRFLIEDCTFKNNGWDGVHLSGSTLPHSSGSIIRNCSFYSNGLEPVENLYCMGIWIERLWNTIIENCVFDHNGYGICISDRTKNTIIRNCSFLSQVRDGVQIGGDFIFLSFAAHTEISHCNFIKNDAGLFLFMTRGTKVHHCRFINNSFVGVLSALSTPRITSNNFINNGRDLPDENESSGVYVWGSFIDLRNNWWGASEGPNISRWIRLSWKIVPIRIVDNGDLVFLRNGFARLRPWLSEPVPDAGRQT